MKVRGNKVFWTSPNGQLAITYSQFDLGDDKYKLYLKKGQYWEYQIAMDSMTRIIAYAKQYAQYRIGGG